jgi:predicted Fe-S protein YdhL (DUF1289 family)
MIESPYVKICTRDVRSKLCLGCVQSINRTEMSAAERGRIMPLAAHSRPAIRNH